jgi:large subunit ribosomal protein L32
MALQKRRLGKSRTRHRRSAWAAGFKKPLVGSCPSCGAPKAQHRVCMSCGHYKGEQVFEAKAEDEE